MSQNLEKRLQRVVDAIHADPAGDHSQDSLADLAALSRFHFSRVYTAMMGEGVMATLRRVRLYRASQMLVQGRLPIAQVAKATGYLNLSAFTRAFSDAYGCPPAAFRKRGEMRLPMPRNQPKGTLMYPVDIRNHGPRRLAAIPHKGPYMLIGRAFEMLSATIGPRGLFPRMGAMVAAYYDSPSDTDPENLRSHAAFECPEDLVLLLPLTEVRLPGGDHAVLTHRGPYSSLPAAYDHLCGPWLGQSDRSPADSPVFEVYLNSPMNTAPDDLITEIWLPLI
jgi:AraC family transcriptional regulator